jgi:hypothetical protein
LGLTRISGKLSIVIPIILILFISLYICPNTQAQSNTSFSPKDQFLIPSSDGAISFAVNGSYSNATLENGSWAFKNLSINGSMPIRNFLVSAQNSNVTIFSYFSFNNTVASLGLIYAVEGNGKQIFNFGQQSHVNGVDWTVVKTVNRRNVFLTPGTDYTISANGTIVVNGATGNFSIFHFSFYNNNLNSNLPFYEQHSVAIATSAAVAIVMVLAVVVAVRNGKYLTEKKLGADSLTKNIERSTSKDEEKT